jgi:hypothetical protein
VLQIFKDCNFKPDDVYDLHSRLTHEIHGQPLTGENMIIHTKELQSQDVCLIRKFADLMFIPYEEK